MAEVRFERVWKRYANGGGAYVIRDLSLAVRDGEFLALVGPSGCGKSTALRLVAGLEAVTAGDLFIGGRRVNDVPPRNRDVAMVFQHYALYPHLSVYDNLAFALRRRRVDGREIEAKVRRAAGLLGIADYLARRPRALSGGQRQRVALGRALVRDPRVFLLDEPLSNLDARLRVQTRAELARLHRATGATMVYVTHDQVEAMTMGDRIAVLDAGAIRQVGAPQALYDAPADLFVAGFIGSPAMNFLDARLVRAGDGAASLVFPTGDAADPRALPLSAALAGQLAGQATAEGRPVVLGVRPEHLRLAPADAPHALAGVADVVEHLGNEQLLYVRVPGALTPDDATRAREAAADGGGIAAGPSVVARLDVGARVTPGERVALAMDTDHLHVFDPATTQRFP